MMRKKIKKDKDFYVKFWSQNGNYSEKLESISADEMVLISSEKVAFYYTKVVLNKPE